MALQSQKLAAMSTIITNATRARRARDHWNG